MSGASSGSRRGAAGPWPQRILRRLASQGGSATELKGWEALVPGDCQNGGDVGSRPEIVPFAELLHEFQSLGHDVLGSLDVAAHRSQHAFQFSQLSGVRSTLAGSR